MVKSPGPVLKSWVRLEFLVRSAPSTLLQPLTPLPQLARLSLCEKLLVAVELAGRINDTQLGTQAIIQAYGLLAPLIHHNIMCYPALKVPIYSVKFTFSRP